MAVSEGHEAGLGIARAKAGVRGIRVEDPGALRDALREGLDGSAPTVIDVVTSFEPSFRDVTSPG